MCTTQQLDLNRLYILKGYMDILAKAPPNGATIHAIRNHLTVLQICIEAGTDLPSDREETIRQVIRRLYPLEVV